MLGPDRRGRRFIGLTSAVMAATLALTAATVAMDGAAQGQPPEGGTLPVPTTMSVAELQDLVDDLNLANEALVANNSSLQQAMDAVTSERDRLARSIERFDELYAPLEADRQLLIELRKQMPSERVEAEAHLARVRSLALAADPNGLGQLVARVDDTAPAFLDWRFGDFATAEEFSAAYVQTGANAFEATFEALRSGVLMSVATRLDGLLNIIDRVR